MKKHIVKLTKGQIEVIMSCLMTEHFDDDPADWDNQDAENAYDYLCEVTLREGF